MSIWEPKPGTGWHKRIRDGRVHWGLILGDDETGPTLFITLDVGDVFIIGYSPRAFEYVVPGPREIQRIELDFGVPAWSVVDVVDREDGHVALVLRAVRVR